MTDEESIWYNKHTGKLYVFKDQVMYLARTGPDMIQWICFSDGNRYEDRCASVEDIKSAVDVTDLFVLKNDVFTIKYEWGEKYIMGKDGDVYESFPRLGCDGCDLYHASCAQELIYPLRKGRLICLGSKRLDKTSVQWRKLK